MGITLSQREGRCSANCLAAMLLGQKHTGLGKPSQRLVGCSQHGGNEFGTSRAGGRLDIPMSSISG